MGIVSTDINYNYNVLQNNISSLKSNFPFLDTNSIGTSVLGNDITCIRLGTGNKEVFYCRCLSCK